MNFTSNATALPACNPLPPYGVPLGIVMSVAGSIGINVGQNLQAAGIAALPESARSKPHTSKTWRFGLLLFATVSLRKFAALALAPSSVLTPIESIQVQRARHMSTVSPC